MPHLVERGESLVETARHADVLGAAAGKEENNTRRGIGCSLGDDALAIAGPQQLHGLRVRTRHNHSAPRVRPPSGGEGERHIGKVDVRMTFEMLGKVVRGAIERGLAAGRQHERLQRRCRITRHRCRRFFDDRVGIRAAHPER